MLLLIAVLAFVIMAIASFLLFGDYIFENKVIDMRLKAINTNVQLGKAVEEEMTFSFKRRIVTPFFENLSSFLSQLVPTSVISMIELKLLKSNGFYGLNAEQFLGLSGVLGFLLAALVGDVMIITNKPTDVVFRYSLFTFVIGSLIPFIMLNHKLITRKAILQRELPDVLDLLTVSVEAGLSFDGALVKLSEKMKGQVVEEFTHMLQEMRIGVPRRDALRALASRCDVQDISLFTSSLIQADQLGVSIAKVLRIQSVDMREKRCQRAEEKAIKAPIKMLFPLILFIFPALFIVLLGPAVLKFIEVFSNK